MKDNKYLKCCIWFFVLYIVQFVVFPILKPKYYPTSNNALAIFLITALLAMVIELTFISDHWKHFLTADVFYGVLLCLFNSRGMYGIGRIGMNLDGLQSRISYELMFLTSLIIVTIYFIIQLMMVFLKKYLCRFVKSQ